MAVFNWLKFTQQQGYYNKQIPEVDKKSGEDFPR